MARLSYASLKVNQGWIQQNIDEVEHLYSSRFRTQAEQRRPFNGRAAELGRAPKAFLPPLIENIKDIEGPNTYHMTLPASHMDVPPKRPFADDAEDSADSIPPAPHNNHYLGYTPSLYPSYDQGISVYAAMDLHRPAAVQQNYLHTHTDSWGSGHNTSSTAPSSHQPSHSMYTYLASPVAGSVAQFASASHTANPAAFKSLQASASDSHPPREASIHHPTIPTPAGLSMQDGSYQAGLGTPGVQAPMGAAAAQYFSNQNAQQQYPMAPPPAITPRPDLSAATFGSAQPNKSAHGPRHPHPGMTAARGHLRNPSLRGEYSVSNVTMDDLDSHFGQ